MSKYSKFYKDMSVLYLSGQSIGSVSKKFGCSNRPVRRALEKFNVRAREGRSFYIINDRFFEKIDSEKKAYCLGMIATDGTIRSNKNRNEIVLSLKESDEQHIVSFLNDIGSNSRVYRVVRSGSKQVYASVSSRRLKQDLIKLGVTPNKSLTLVAPTVDRQFERHFWRGCFDGDGCFCIIKGKYWAASFNGSISMVTEFKKFLDRNIRVNDNKIYDRGKIYSLAYRSQPDVAKIADLLYSGSSRHLERKFGLYENIIGGADGCS